MIPPTLRPWLLATRPRTLPAALAPVVMGVTFAVAEGGFHLAAALACAAGATLLQIGTNFANDYYDFVNGADTAERVGPKRATQSGWVTPAAMKRAFVLCFGLATLVGAYLVLRAGWPIVVIGLSGIAFGVLYTGGPKPLGYLGLGDALVLVFFGPVAVAGTVYAQTLSFHPIAAFAGLAPGLLSTAILAVNNLRDVDTDRACGKRTLAVRFGAGFARGEYVVCLVVAALVPIALWARGDVGYGVLLPLAVVPLGVALTRAVLRSSGAALNPLLGQTGKLLVLYAVLFSAGHAWSSVGA